MTDADFLALSYCRGCGKVLDPSLVGVADGCPCNHPSGINHGLVPVHICTCNECDPAQTGAVRKQSQGGTVKFREFL